ncbi:MAG: hypothetical protein QMD71_07495 [bacterium]|nr:hypothetical protein [bacterium]
MDIINSLGGIPIRMIEERWLHIVENHSDVAGYYDEILNTVENPEFIIKGCRNALIAISKKDKRSLAIVHKELSKTDGFIITAYFTSKLDLDKEEILWQKQP